MKEIIILRTNEVTTHRLGVLAREGWDAVIKGETIVLRR